MDIHSGGVDLIFPHHENELTQSEAYFSHDKWVRLFLHVGHLSIDNQKVSRRERNFTTIKEMLERFSGRVLRLAFTRHQYNEPLNFSEGLIEEAKEKDKKYKNFFEMIKIVVRENSLTETDQKLEPKDKELKDQFDKIKERIHNCLLDNLDTRGVFTEVDELVRLTNTYMQIDKSKALLLS